MEKCNKKSYIIIYIIYNNIKIIFTISIRVMSGEFKTEIEIEMGHCVFFAFAYEKKSANT